MTEPASLSDDAPRADRADLQRRAIHGAAWTLLHTVIVIVLGFAVNIVLARTLGVVDYGRLAILTAAMSIASGVITMGLGSGLVQFGAKAHARGDRAGVRAMLSASQGFRLMIEAPALTLVVILLADLSTSLVVTAILFGIWLPAALSGAAACLGIENKTAAGAQIMMITNLLTQAAVVLAAVIVSTADSVWVARLVAGSVVVVLALLRISPDYRGAVLKPAFPFRFPRGFWRFAIPSGLAGLIAGLVLSRSEIFVLGWVSTPEEVGVFAMAFGLASHLFGPAQALVGPLIPAVSALREVEPQAVVRAFRRTLRAASTVVALLVATALPALALLVPSIYGSEFITVPAVLVVLGMAGSVVVLSGPIEAFVNSRLASGALLRFGIAAVAVNAALAFPLIARWGAWGAVAANVGAAVCYLALIGSSEIKALGLSASKALHDICPLLVGVVACSLGWGCVQGLRHLPIVASGVAAAVGLTSYIIGLRLARAGLTQDDASAIARVVPPRAHSFAGRTLHLLAHARGMA